MHFKMYIIQHSKFLGFANNTIRISIQHPLYDLYLDSLYVGSMIKIDYLIVGTTSNIT